MRPKIITLCGSMRFLEQMQQLAEQLELEKNYAVIPPLPHALPQPLTPDQQSRLNALHRAKIDLSDGIFVVNPGGYIGQTTRSEIEYAQALGKEILFLEKSIQIPAK